MAPRITRPQAKVARVKTASLADEAYAQLKRRIIRCEMEPGLSITEAQLVRAIGIGKTPVREALARLVQDGLARNLPKRGYEVMPITLADVQELFGLRMINEAAAAQLAAGHVDVDRLRRLDELCRAGYTLGDAESAERFLRANREFHITIAEASGNHRLATLLKGVLEESERVYHLGIKLRNRSDEIAHEHKELVDALVAGDADAARRITLEQLVASQRMVLDALMTSPTLQAAPVGLRALRASA